jgi:hypothetical protein
MVIHEFRNPAESVSMAMTEIIDLFQKFEMIKEPTTPQ